jgi:protein phosphatase
MRIDIGHVTDLGQQKKRNEDNYGIYKEDASGIKLFTEGALLCVADGLGGHMGGEIASKLAISVFKDMLKSPPLPPSEDPVEMNRQMEALLGEFVGLANDNIYQTNVELVKNGRPMGTTLLAALVLPAKVHIVNIGDSRCYLIREGQIADRTEDHSWVDEQVKLGLMSKEQAETDRRRNLLTRSLGTHPTVTSDKYHWSILPGDVLLLCTDGLVNMVEDADICAEIKTGGTPMDIAQRLVDRANRNGGIDNITVVLAHISPKPMVQAMNRVSSFLRKRGKFVVRVLLIAVFGLVCFGAGFLLRPILAK